MKRSIRAEAVLDQLAAQYGDVDDELVPIVTYHLGGVYGEEDY